MWNELRGRFLKSSFLKDSFGLIAGNGIAQILGMVFISVIATLYSPEDYGQYGVFVGFVSLFSVMSGGRYELAILIPERERDAAGIVGIGIILNVITALFSVIFFLFYFQVMGKAELNGNGLSFYGILCLGFSAAGIFQFIQNWQLRKKEFYNYSLTRIFQVLIFGLAGCLSGIWALKHGLLWSYALSWVLVIGWMIYFLVYVQNASFFQSRIEYWNLIKRFREFPLFNAGPAFINTLSSNFPLIILMGYFQGAVVGFFTLARQVASLPIIVLASPFSQSVFQKISEKIIARESVSSALLKVTTMLSLISVAFGVGMFFFAELAFEFFFGKKWLDAANYGTLFSISCGIQLVSTVLSKILVSLGKVKVLSSWQLAYFCAMLTLWFFKNDTFDTFVRIYVLIDCFLYAIYGIVIWYFVREYEQNLKKSAA